MLRLYRSSFHNVHRTFLHVNPTHPFTNDLESCTWTEQVTNCPQGFIASDSDRGRLNLQCSNAALWTWKGGTCRNMFVGLTGGCVDIEEIVTT